MVQTALWLNHVGRPGRYDTRMGRNGKTPLMMAEVFIVRKGNKLGVHRQGLPARLLEERTFRSLHYPTQARYGWRGHHVPREHARLERQVEPALSKQ